MAIIYQNNWCRSLSINCVVNLFCLWTTSTETCESLLSNGSCQSSYIVNGFSMLLSPHTKLIFLCIFCAFFCTTLIFQKYKKMYSNWISWSCDLPDLRPIRELLLTTWGWGNTGGIDRQDQPERPECGMGTKKGMINNLMSSSLKIA